MAQRAILSDNVLNEIEKMITSTMKAGDRIPTEKELAEQFSVGRSTIRESLKALVAKGLIVRNTEGTFVSDQVNKCLVAPLNLLINMEIGNVDDLLELRKLIELGAIRIAAENINEEAILRLKKINWQLQEPGASASALQERDIAFHSVIAEATGNKLLMELLNAIRFVIAKNIENEEVPIKNIHEACKQHELFIAALEAHDPEKAYSAMFEYFRFNEEMGSYSRL